MDLGVAGRVVVADDLINNESEKFLAEGWVEASGVGERTQPSDLYRFAVRVSRLETNTCLVFTDPFGDLEPFCQ